MKWITGKKAKGACSAKGAQWTCPFAAPNGTKYLAAWDIGGGSTFKTGIYTRYTDISDNVVVTGPNALIQLTLTPIFLAQK